MIWLWFQKRLAISRPITTSYLSRNADGQEQHTILFSLRLTHVFWEVLLIVIMISKNKIYLKQTSISMAYNNLYSRHIFSHNNQNHKLFRYIGDSEIAHFKQQLWTSHKFSYVKTKSYLTRFWMQIFYRWFQSSLDILNSYKPS